MQIIQPRSEPDESPIFEPRRPYQDYVESEVRQYWQEIGQQHNLTKPTKWEIVDAIRVLAVWNRSGYSTINPVPQTMQQRLNAGTAKAMEPRRPCQDFAENEAREYWQETAKEHNLAKPTRKEIRAAAMPILCQALRNRFGNQRHRAVAAIVRHARERGWIKQNDYDAHDSPAYIDALIQLADDAYWLALEIPLPDHLPPHHPPIYYTIDSSPVPVPRKDDLIRADYLYRDRSGSINSTEPRPVLLISVDYIYPSAQPLNDEYDQDLPAQGRAYYSLKFMPVRGPINRKPVEVWVKWRRISYGCRETTFASLYCLHFLPHP